MPRSARLELSKYQRVETKAILEAGCHKDILITPLSLNFIDVNPECSQ